MKKVENKLQEKHYQETAIKLDSIGQFIKVAFTWSDKFKLQL